MTLWKAYKPGLEKTEQTEFHGWKLNLPSVMEEVGAFEVEEMTDEKALELLDKVAELGKHSRIRRLYDTKESIEAYALVERDWALAVLEEVPEHQEEEKEI